MATVEFWSFGPNAGYRVLWYRDDDGNSGQGDNPRLAYWYVDSLKEAHALAANEDPPAGATFYPIAD